MKMTSFLMKKQKGSNQMQIGIYNQTKEKTRDIATIIDKIALNCSFNLSIVLYNNIENLIYDIQDGMYFNVLFVGINRDNSKNDNTLRKIGYNGEIVLCSEKSVVKISSQMIDATGVIVKPYCEKFIFELLNNINSKTIKNYQLQYRGSIIQLNFDEIIFIESCNNKCKIHTSSGEIFIEYKKLCDIENELNDKRFLRSHQSFLVNMDKVRSVSDKFEMLNGEIASITQRNLKKIKTTFINYIKSKVIYEL